MRRCDFGFSIYLHVVLSGLCSPVCKIYGLFCAYKYRYTEASGYFAEVFILTIQLKISTLFYAIIPEIFSSSCTDAVRRILTHAACVHSQDLHRSCDDRTSMD